MLQPSNRLTLIDAMRPPAGHQFDSAMAVTYTLDLMALLAAPAAFALATTEGVRSTGQEPIELLHAVRRHADRITVFHQTGSIALPPSRKVFAFLEGSVLPVVAPRGGVVHPKVWVLRYAPSTPTADDPEWIHRVLVASRNLTFDESWDTLVRFDEATAHDGADLSGVADLFEALVPNSARPLRDDEQRRIAQLANALRTGRFAVPAGVESVTVHPLGLASRQVPFPARADRCVVVSPFLSDGFFSRVLPCDVDELVSRGEAIDALGDSTRQRIAHRWVLDDGSALEPVTDDRGRDASDPGTPLLGLHAKAFAFETAGRAHLFLGSANATTAAFERNVEVLVELVGSIRHLGIDALFDGNGDEPGLRSLLVGHVERDRTDDEAEDTVLEVSRRLIASLDIRGFAQPSDGGWLATYRSTGPIPDGPTAVTCWPLSSEGHRRDVPVGVPLDAGFETTVESLSGFLAFELTHGDLTTAFVVPVPMEGIPDERDRLLLKSLIGNAERFFRYLLAMLDDADPERIDTRSRIDRLVGDGTIDPTTDLPVLERLLRTLRRDPSKLLSLDPLVRDLDADDVLPDGFVELWSMLVDAGYTRCSDDR